MGCCCACDDLHQTTCAYEIDLLGPKQPKVHQQFVRLQNSCRQDLLQLTFVDEQQDSYQIQSPLPLYCHVI